MVDPWHYLGGSPRLIEFSTLVVFLPAYFSSSTYRLLRNKSPIEISESFEKCFLSHFITTSRLELSAIVEAFFLRHFRLLMPLPYPW
jgi:hypothetical protein